MATQLDPFTEVYNALYDAFEAEHEIERRIVPRSRVRLDGDGPNPTRVKVASADMPELRLDPGSCLSELFHTSTGAKIVQDYLLTMSSQEVRVQRDIFPIKWAVLRAISKGSPKLGLTYVKRVDVMDSVDELDQEAARGRTAGSRGTPGWEFTMTIQVTMFIARSRLTRERGN